MASKLIVVVCFALFAAAVAESIYTDDQIDEINSRIAKCLQPLPTVPKGSFYRPGDDCRFRAGITPIIEEGASKDEIAGPIVQCIVKSGIKFEPAVLSKASQCLYLSLAEPLTVEESDNDSDDQSVNDSDDQSVNYTDDQVDEINARIAKCLQPLPAVPKGGIYRPSDDCRFRAGITPITEQGATKDEIAGPIAKCLVQRGIKPGKALAKATQCLYLSLAKPL